MKNKSAGSTAPPENGRSHAELFEFGGSASVPATGAASPTSPVAQAPSAPAAPSPASAAASFDKSDPIFGGLNEAQRQAVAHGEGPLLIVAGAGTGKTTVLTRRIANLIVTKKALPSQILALTFTDKSAGEMEERVDRLVPYGFNDVWVSTFHSFGDKILRDHAFEIGLSTDFRVLTQPEAVVFLRQHLFELELEYYRPLNDPTRFVESLLSTFSRAQDEEVSPEEFARYAAGLVKSAADDEEAERAKKCAEVAKAYGAYEELKRRFGFIDFGDQVLLCLKILRERPSILKKIQARYRYILVDEFQDTNYAQFELLKKLAGAHRNITVVGDDDQSIYKFRGACLANILDFRKAYPEAKQVVLQDNYRSTQEILDGAYKLIQHNNPDRLEYQDRLNKLLRAERGSGAPIAYRAFDTLFSECEFIAAEIKRKLDSGKAQPKDIAILVRTNANAEPFIQSLNLAGVPWRFSGNAGLYERDEIRIALAFLRTLDNPADSASLYYLAVSPLYGLDAEDCAHLTQAAEKSRRPLLEIFKNFSSLEPPIELKPASHVVLKKIVDDLARFRLMSAKVATGQLLYQFFEDSGVLKRLAEASDYASVQEAQNLQRFFEIIKKFGQVSQYDRVHTFVQHLDALRTAGEDPSSAEASFEENAVQILTAHAAKGLEFEVVFLAGLEQGHFPVSDRPDPIELPEALVKDTLSSGNYHLQEERRLFYVGMTRAKRELILSSARDMGKKKIWKPSQFILEALDRPTVDETVLKMKPLDSLKAFSAQSAPAAQAPGELADSVALPATAVDDYMTCPLRYKFARVLKIPVLMHHTAVFGIAIHEALKAYHTAKKGVGSPGTELEFAL